MRQLSSCAYIGLLAMLFSCSPKASVEQPKVFLHGVASGDPLQDRVIIWTRVTSPEPTNMIAVDWELSVDTAFTGVLKYGKYTTNADRDFTVKVDLKDLSPGTRYYYRFKALDEVSPIGFTRTVAAKSDSLKLAIVSCSNYEWGYFNTYGRIADRKDLDAVIHLGDYIYEYGTGVYGDTTLGRINNPLNECITLNDYRKRYALYRTDKDLQAAHGQHPFITVWDDHEVANDSHATGAQNHQPEEGDYNTRKAAAKKAYYEWLPIRENEKLYRKVSFGNLADLIMLDERLEGRSPQSDSLTDPNFNDPERSMLGKEQLSWFENALSASGAIWKIIGNQVIFSDLKGAGGKRNLDSWEGYPAEKQRIARFLLTDSIANVIWVTGDTHSSWAFETIVMPVSEDPVGVEFGVTSVNSGNFDEGGTLEDARIREKQNLENNPHLKYSNVTEHGYILLSIQPDSTTAKYYFVDTVKKPSTQESIGYSTTVVKGDASLK